MFNPVSTYRIQFHKDFTFSDLDRIIPYLKKLGVQTLYASPIFEAVPGSTHGYDGVNPHQINPEIGTELKLREISAKLQEAGISWLQDVVPNHMAFHPKNVMLTDVLEKGPLSVYTSFFDTSLVGSFYHGRIMVPFLGSPLGEVVEKGELKVDFDGDRLVLKYYDDFYPLNPRSYPKVLKGDGAASNQSIDLLLKQLEDIKHLEDAKAYSEGWEEIRKQIVALFKNEASAAQSKSNLEKINSDKHLLQEIADEQAYRLTFWQDSDKQINYRRFFTVNSLICLNIHNPEVFTEYHRYIKTLLDDGIFQGLRIDHIDGLYDPSGYLNKLREVVGEDTYIVVEKILEPEETLPEIWPIQGNTGYDFLSMVNNLFTYSASGKSFTEFYEKLIGESKPVQDQIREKKAYILFQHMNGELENLYHFFLDTTSVEKDEVKKIPQKALTEAIGEFLIQCPVYRYYGNQFPLEDTERKSVQNIFDRIKQSKPELKDALSLLEQALLINPQNPGPAANEPACAFYQRCMQFSGPLMAKGVEDTLMYTYNRFIGHNEVGDSPESFGLSVDEFHQKMIDRQKKAPLSLNATSTHDTKRGEDVRARLNVLSDLSDEWFRKVEEWLELNADLKADGAPDTNDEYFIYQNLVGIYPMPGSKDENLKTRIGEYLEKALREAKRHSNWTTPNLDYEEKTIRFAQQLLDPARPFLKNFEEFHRKIADGGVINSLAQVILKFTTPGVPDIYQGCELWDFSLVDPDNRRPVDFEKRQNLLAEFESQQNEQFISELWQNRFDGKIKLWLTQKLLSERQSNPEALSEGHYIPLEIKGKLKSQVLAFARRFNQTWYVIVLPLHTALLNENFSSNFRNYEWKSAELALPLELFGELENVLTRERVKANNRIPLADLFQTLPFAVLKFEAPQSKRSAGILMSITSLPSNFGIGDFGPEARKFADFLAKARQKYWQLLPLNPVERAQQYSPYSSTSSMAGNPLLISPELLAEAGLLDKADLKKYRLPNSSEVDYEEAERIKKEMFKIAYNRFETGSNSALRNQFLEFCEREAAWLDDFALYEVLKQKNASKPWFEWPQQYKFRQHEALEQFAQENEGELNKIKWIQFVFDKQWKELKAYCNSLGISLFGDLPFYISYDSVDVWANPEIFSLDDDGKVTFMAGVPPDYFNENGQLWGMPVFNNDVLRKQNYRWWIDRLRKNLQMYDVLRLDHFRAFSAYWEVPASEETAKNGTWKPGLGAEFFEAVQKELGELPFIAEDLGDIDPPVYDLRDRFNFPGMKVLQFAFGDDMPNSLNIPHNYTENYIVYTGTHDNNTTRGWFRTDAEIENKKQLKRYFGRSVNERNVPKVLCRCAYSSVAKTVILPIQDVLGLDESARMNTPALVTGNWRWRLTPRELTQKIERRLRKWVVTFNRA